MVIGGAVNLIQTPVTVFGSITPYKILGINSLYLPSKNLNKALPFPLFVKITLLDIDISKLLSSK